MTKYISRNHELLQTHIGEHKMFKFIRNFLVSIQKATVAAHFARLGQTQRANDIIGRG